MKSRLLLLAAMFAAGTAVAKAPEPLSLPVAPSLPVEIVLSQKDGLAVRPWVNPMDMIVSGALITGIAEWQRDATVKANTPRLQVIRDRVAGTDFNAKLEAAVRAVLMQGRLTPNPQISVVSQPWTGEEELAKTAETNGIYLRVDPFYGFDSAFNSLEVSIVVSARKVSRKSSGKPREEPATLYRRYSFNTTMPDQRYKMNDASAARWKELSDDELRAAIDEGITQSAAMFAYDMSDEGQAAIVGEVKAKRVVIAFGIRFGDVLRTVDDITWYWERDLGVMAQRMLVLDPSPAP